MSLSFTASGYEDLNKGGLQRVFGVGKSARYNHLNEALLDKVSFDAILSSIQVNASSNATANVILFANFIVLDLFPFKIGDFAGEFRQVVAAKNGAPNFANMTDFAFDNFTHSMLLVNTGRANELRLSFRDLFLDEWKSAVDALGSKASRKGDPLMTWSAFPEGANYLSPDQIYLVIKQRLNINLDWWPDYDASITYHLYFFLDGAKKLQGYCQRWDAWVEEGTKSDDIMDDLWPKVEKGVSTLDDRIAKRVATLPAFKDFYYLPGRQLSPVSGVASGTTWDDVTLVFEV
jgi:hypothetical protein